MALTAAAPFVMLAPSGTPYWQFRDRNGVAVTADASGVLSGLTYAQYKDAEGAGCTLFTYGQLPVGPPTYQAMTNTSAATLAAANFSSALDQTINMTGTLGGAATLTLPTAATIAAVIPGAVAQGAWFRLRIMNEGAGAYAWTLTADSGATWTLHGGVAVAQYMFRDFIVTIAAGGLTGVIQAVGYSDNAAV